MLFALLCNNTTGWINSRTGATMIERTMKKCCCKFKIALFGWTCLWVEQRICYKHHFVALIPTNSLPTRHLKSFLFITLLKKPPPSAPITAGSMRDVQCRIIGPASNDSKRAMLCIPFINWSNLDLFWDIPSLVIIKRITINSDGALEVWIRGWVGPYVGFTPLWRMLYERLMLQTTMCTVYCTRNERSEQKGKRVTWSTYRDNHK